MTTIEKIRAEIERRLIGYDPEYTNAGKELNDLLAFLDTLKETPTWVIRAEQRKKDQASGKKFAIMEIRSEIERIMSRAMNEEGQDICEYILDFLDTLPEQPVEGLEEAAKEYAILPMDVGEGKVCIDKKVKRAFIAGAEWQMGWLDKYEKTDEISCITHGQAGADGSGNVVVIGGKIEWDEESRLWMFAPGSADSEVHILQEFFSDLRPCDGPVDVTIETRRKRP